MIPLFRKESVIYTYISDYSHQIDMKPLTNTLLPMLSRHALSSSCVFSIVIIAVSDLQSFLVACYTHSCAPNSFIYASLTNLTLSTSWLHTNHYTHTFSLRRWSPNYGPPPLCTLCVSACPWHDNNVWNNLCLWINIFKKWRIWSQHTERSWLTNICKRFSWLGAAIPKLILMIFEN